MQDTPTSPTWPERLRRALPFLSLAIFGLALWGIHRTLHRYHYHEVLRGLRAIPPSRVGLAVVFMILAYTALTGYDALALRYIRHPLPYRRIGLASFVSYAFSNTIGFAFLVGTSLRYRLYSSWGIAAPDIVRIVAFCWVTLWTGLLTVTGTALIAEPSLTAQFGIPSTVTQPLGFLFLSVVIAYLTFTVRARRPVRLRELVFPVPPLRLAIPQLLVSCAEWLLASSVLYVLLPAGTGLNFPTLASIYVFAQTVGLASHVPGGLGVFESVILLFGQDGTSPTALAGALLAYRAIYYVLPLGVAIVTLGGHELVRRAAHVRRTATAFGRWVPQLAPTLFAAGVFTTGAILIFSGATPEIPERLRWLAPWIPLPLLEISHLLGSLTGVGLLLLAQGLQRRLDAAWVMTSILLAIGTAASLLKGVDYEEAAVLLIVLGALLPCRRFFYRHGSLVAERFTTGWIIMIAVVLAASVWLTMFAFRHVEYSSSLWWRFALHSDAPRALRAAVGMLASIVIVGVALLLRPVPPEPAEPTSDDLDRTRRIVAASPHAEANLALLGDKQFLFNTAGTGFIMYGVEGRSWVALRDPICPAADDVADLAWAFRELVDRHAGYPVFYEVSRAYLPVYVDLGLALIKLGEEARVPLPTFSLEGGSRASLRRFHRACAKVGCEFEILSPAHVTAVLPELRQVSDAWLALKKTREKRFSLGAFDEPYVAQFPISVVRQQGRIVAFANLWTSGGHHELTVDLMRHLPEAPPSVMTYLFVELMLWGREQGYQWFNLGMAPLSGLDRRKLAPLWSRLGGFVFHQGGHFYNFQGLRQYKERFDPVWEPRYLAAPGGLVLPRVLTSIATLIGGGLKGVVTR